MANLKSFGTAQVRGDFGRGYSIAEAGSWWRRAAHDFKSDSDKEVHKLLGRTTYMQEWLGRRKSKTPKPYTLTVVNRPFSSGIEFTRPEIRRDKTGQIRKAIMEHGQRTALWPEDILTAVLLANGTAYDGTALFADRSSLDSGGSIDNDGTSDITTPTAPTAVEFAAAIASGVSTLMLAKDEEGAPLNQGSKSFDIMIPANMIAGCAGAIGNDFLAAGLSNDIKKMGVTFQWYVNGWLPSQALFYMYRTDGARMPLILQEEGSVNFEAQAEGSDYAIENNAHRYWAERNGEAAAGEPGVCYRHTFT